LYRWHATTSNADAQWTSSEFQKMFGDKAYNEVTPNDFKTAARTFLQPPKDVKTWTFGGCVASHCE
jgi:linoleate 10R-lipoxygenase